MTNLGWKNVSLKSNKGQTISSKAGTIDIMGDIESYQYELQGDFNSGKYAIKHYLISGQGNLIGTTVKQFTVEALGGDIKGAATLSWIDGLHWQAKFNGNNLKSRNLFP